MNAKSACRATWGANNVRNLTGFDYPSLPYLLAGLVIAEDHRHRRYRGDSLGNHSAICALSSFAPYRFGLLKRMLTFSVPSVGDGAAVVLSDCTRLSAKRAGTIAGRYPPDLSRDGWHSLCLVTYYSGIIRFGIQSISAGSQRRAGVGDDHWQSMKLVLRARRSGDGALCLLTQGIVLFRTPL